MDTMIYLDQENGRLTTPAIKSRQNRLHSAPGQCQWSETNTLPFWLLNFLTKSFIYVCHIYRSVLENTPDRKGMSWRPLQSSRKALGVINKVVATPAASLKAEEKTKPAEAKVRSWSVYKPYESCL